MTSFETFKALTNMTYFSEVLSSANVLVKDWSCIDISSACNEAHLVKLQLKYRDKPNNYCTCCQGSTGWHLVDTVSQISYHILPYAAELLGRHVWKVWKKYAKMFGKFWRSVMSRKGSRYRIKAWNQTTSWPWDPPAPIFCPMQRMKNALE